MSLLIEGEYVQYKKGGGESREEEGGIVRDKYSHAQIAGTIESKVLDEDHVLILRRGPRRTNLAEVTSLLVVQDLLVLLFHVLDHFGVGLLNI